MAFCWFCDIDSLAPGDSTACDFTGDIPASITAGTYFLVVRVEDGAAVNESNETTT